MAVFRSQLMMASLRSRRALVVALLLVLIIIALPGSTFAQETAPGDKSQRTLKVFGDDERELVTDTTRFPWSTIGIVQAWWDKNDGTVLVSSGTGTLIGNRVVITCGHCVYDSARGLADGITFIPARNGAQEPFGRSEAERSIVHPQWVSGQSSQHDLALLVLKSALGEEAGYLPVVFQPVSFFTGRNFNTAGYPGEDLPGDLQYHAFGPTQGVDGNFIRHEIDSEPGQSGSPLWYYEPDPVTRNLVGVLTGSRETRVGGQVTEVYNVGIHLNESFVAWINETLAAHDSVSVDVPTATGNDDVTPDPSDTQTDDSGTTTPPLCGSGAPGAAMSALGFLGFALLSCRRIRSATRAGREMV